MEITEGVVFESPKGLLLEIADQGGWYLNVQKGGAIENHQGRMLFDVQGRVLLTIAKQGCYLKSPRGVLLEFPQGEGAIGNLKPW